LLLGLCSRGDDGAHGRRRCSPHGGPEVRGRETEREGERKVMSSNIVRDIVYTVLRRAKKTKVMDKG
jgi:hypothetical protein